MMRLMKAKQRRAEVNVQVDRYVRILQRVGTLPGGVPGRGEDEMKGKGLIRRIATGCQTGGRLN